MSNTSNQQLKSLFAGSGLGQEAVSTMDLTADTLGPAIMAGLGVVSIDDIDASEIFLVGLVVDYSSSIRFGSNTDLVRQGHNLVLESLKGSKSSSEILISCQYLNGDVLYPFVLLDQAIEMTPQNYNPSGGTPLYDMTAAALAGVAAKSADFEQGGVAVRSATFVITDGADMGSRTFGTPQSVRPIVEGLLKTESHIVGAMGIDDGQTDFVRIFEAMGVPRAWIMTPNNDPSEIRRCFGTISQSAVRASQTAGSFSATALGGFGN
jgi:hypothetical protein